MAAFIVISADNHLHYLVDGIEKSRPLNPNVSAEISTGKITKSETGYVYEYTIFGQGITSDKSKTFSDLLSNQLAAFRLANTIQSEEVVNIFFLENPLTEEDLAESESWLEDFDKVYHAGQGHDTNFCLFRVIFTYNHDNPSDVSVPIDSTALGNLLENHKKAVSHNLRESAKPSFERYLFYFDNQKNDAAALCLNKDEHDLKMPRILIDFMMLVSNSSDKYNIIAAIDPPGEDTTTRCFSVGYAESMYYYPDVERYFIHADNRDIHNEFLDPTDEKSAEEGKDAMDIEKYPFGLRSRLNRLGVIYNDIPFIDNIANYPTSADMKIDNCIVALRELLVKKREKEYENFMNSAEVVECNKRIENYESQMASAQPSESEPPEEFDMRIKHLSENKEKVIKELEQLKQGFEPDCPIYINRTDIYNELHATDEKDKERLLNSHSDHYSQLVNFAKSKKFQDFVKEISEEKASIKSAVVDHNTDKRGAKKHNNFFKALFSWLPFLQRNKKNIENSNTNSLSSDVDIPKSNLTTLDSISCIIEQLELKKRFETFKKEVSSIEQVYKKEKEYCEQFKLTTHTNHFYPLINLQELKKEHAETSKTRIPTSVNLWRLGDQPVKTNLLQIIKDEASKYTRNHYAFIDWTKPFSFIQEISEETNMPTICNELQKRAAPIVNYNLTSEIKEDKVSRCFFSDRPQFKDEMEKIRPKLNNGIAISATMSTHTASKICMFQFLPMKKNILDNLVDLQPS